MKKYCKPVAGITKLEPLHVIAVSLDDEVSQDPPAAKGNNDWETEEDFDSGGFDW